MSAVWGCAVVAVTLISLVGLVAVALIPIMSHRAFYNHLLHFLVAVAIATLTGDALLHLLPHVSINVICVVISETLLFFSYTPGNKETRG